MNGDERPAAGYDNRVRIGYARVSTRIQDQAQLGALAGAHCREVVVETGLHRTDGATIADRMLFMVAAMAAEMERDLIHFEGAQVIGTHQPDRPW